MAHPSITRGLSHLSTKAFVKQPLILFRADDRKPSEIIASGGFFAKGLSKSAVSPPDTSLWNHIKGKDGFSTDDDMYVSTSASENLAAQRAKFSLRNIGIVYRIHSFWNCIPCRETLHDYYPLKDEEEYAAIGGIMASQILGWSELHNGMFQKYVEHEGYRADLYEEAGHAGPQFHLAGYPRQHCA